MSTTDAPEKLTKQLNAVNAQNVEELVQGLINIEAAALTEEQSKLLSKALFPDTHTAEIEVLGVKRTVRPLTIKYSRRVNETLKQLNNKVTVSIEGTGNINIDQEMLDGFIGVCETLCEFYGWDDIKKKIAEEDIGNNDLMLMAMTQQNIQGTNDFLLMPLRLLLKVAQLQEILAVRLGERLHSTTSSMQVS